eukprot:jgi/Botrbrau1/20363/Bobra.0006s0028.1
MDMKEEFQRGVTWVQDSFNAEQPCSVSVFETIIRVVGGMLAAYELSGDPVLLSKCEGLARLLSVAFDSPMGFPQGSISLKYHEPQSHNWISGSAILSELGSVQLEFLKLSQLTGNRTYGDMAEKIIYKIHERYPDAGLLPTYLRMQDGSGSGQLTMGALADSYYEYLLKVWLLKGRAKSAEMYRSMWEKAMDDMRARLVQTPEGTNLTYVGESYGGGVVTDADRKMEHLTCFIAGNLALGVQTGAVVGSKADEYLDLAKALTYTCYQMYVRMPTGLAPEFVVLAKSGLQLDPGFSLYNILRPEVVESIFMMSRITGDPQYKEWGWTIFQAFQKWAKVGSGGYSGHHDVTKVPPAKNNKQESFWLAETLKYLYLLYSPADVIPLDSWIFNTEAHPLKVINVAQEATQAAEHMPEALN